MNNKQFQKTRNLTLMAAIIAIMLVMTMIPFLGYIPLGFMNATIIHIPVIIGAIILGPKSGAMLGLIFGLSSLWRNSTMPNPTSFVFSPLVGIPGIEHRGIISCLGSLVLCLLPRILIGVVAYYVYKAVMKMFKNKQNLALMCAGIAGSLTNTLLVMNFIYLFFGSQYAQASNREVGTLYNAILVIIGTQGVPEAIVAGILTALICRVLLKIMDSE